jgi:NADH-quinone oxidoreductase subunit J
MIVHALAFYMFAAVAVAAGVMVISARNPVHSVLFLILAFFNSAGLFILIGAEFLAMILVVVYVGAVAVLFMFVVMMLELSTLYVREGMIRLLPVGLLVGLILLAELILVGGTYVVAGTGEAVPATVPLAASNIQAIGDLLYTHYVYAFQAAGMILLVAMIGAITLTLRHRPVRRQDIGRQVSRLRADAVELRKVRSGSGV